MPGTLNRQDRKICEAALRLAASHGWGHVTPDRVARAAKISVARIKSRCADPDALLSLIVDCVSAESFAACDKPDTKTPPRDRLFDAMMARFDFLQAHRKAIGSIAAAARRDPRMGPILASAQIKAMKKTLAFTGLAVAGPCGNLTPFALWGVFLAAFRVWQGDETLDMSRTMAALDRYLRYADKAAILLRSAFVPF